MTDKIIDGALKIIADDIKNYNEEREQIFLTVRRLNALSARLLEQEYYLSLPEARETEDGIKERQDSTKRMSKDAIKEILITLEMNGVREGVMESISHKLSTRAGKIREKEYLPTSRRTE